MRNCFFQTLLYFWILFLSCCASPAQAEPALKVLFIGNSLTAANDLPRVIADVAKSHGREMLYDSYTPGGARLANHADNSKVMYKIRARRWDYVVLQEQSQFTGFSAKQLSKDVYPFARSLAEFIRRSHSGTKVVFYMTMARRNGDPANRHVSSDLLTYEGMQNRVNRAYLEMAKSNKAIVAPVGKVWELALKRNPGLELYADDVHPNLKGTYLTACVFYNTLFRSPSVGASAPHYINRDNARTFQKLADEIVLSAKSEWDFR